MQGFALRRIGKGETSVNDQGSEAGWLSGTCFTKHQIITFIKLCLITRTRSEIYLLDFLHTPTCHFSVAPGELFILELSSSCVKSVDR
jgi:hypothetical protein